MGILIEKVHGMNVGRLIKEFGEDKEDEIADLYKNAREIADKTNPKSFDIVYQEVKKTLKNKYDPSSYLSQHAR